MYDTLNRTNDIKIDQINEISPHRSPTAFNWNSNRAMTTALFWAFFLHITTLNDIIKLNKFKKLLAKQNQQMIQISSDFLFKITASLNLTHWRKIDKTN